MENPSTGTQPPAPPTTTTGDPDIEWIPAKSVVSTDVAGDVIIEYYMRKEAVQLVNPPPGRCWHSSALVSQRYVFLSGGYSGFNYFDDLNIFDCEKRRWVYSMNAVIKQRYAHTTSVVGDWIYLIAGARERTYLRGVMRIPSDISDYTGSQTHPPKQVHAETISKTGPSVRAAHMVAVVGKKIYCFGGDAGKGVYFNELYTFDCETSTWTKIDATGTIPSPRAWGTLSLVGTKLYLLCGTNGSVLFNDIYILDTATNVWSTPNVTGDKPQGRHSHSAAVLATNIYMYGGSGDGKFQSFSDVHVFSTQNNSWTTAKFSGQTPTPRYGAYFVGKNMFVFGGCVVNKATGSRSYTDEVFILTPDVLPKLKALACTLSEDLSILINNKDFFPDVCFLVEGKQVYAHKAILAARNSDYFRNMFCGNLRERSASEISLPDISHAVFLRVLEYTYTGSLKGLSDNDFGVIIELLEVAHMYNMAPLSRMCEQVLLDKIQSAGDIGTVVQVFEVAVSLVRKSLQAVCLDWLLGHSDTPIPEAILATLSPEAREQLTSLTPV